MYRLPANHGSVYSLMHALLDRGIEAKAASAAIDLVLGELPDLELDLPGEGGTLADDDQLGLLVERWDPAGEYAPTSEDLESLAQYYAEVDERTMLARWASDFDDEQERRHMVTDRDVACVQGGVG